MCGSKHADNASPQRAVKGGGNAIVSQDSGIDNSYQQLSGETSNEMKQSGITKDKSMQQQQCSHEHSDLWWMAEALWCQLL